MEFLIISGMSGAGKSMAADILEDMDYYCVDNMPVALLSRFAELCIATGGRYERVALVTDVRERESIPGLIDALDKLWEQGLEYRILYVEADTPTIVRRYKSSRRPHPMLSGGSIEEASRRTASSMEQHPMLAGGSIEEAVRREVALLAPLRERADYIINTTGLTTAMLQARIADILPDGRAGRRLTVTVTAFGYKYGLPMDADLVFDVRFLPNPFYVEELRSMSGLDKPVSDFVFSCGDARRFLEMLVSMLKFLMPLYLEEGKYNLNIAIGCTGGRHRSVAVTNALADRLSELGFQTARSFRDLEKG